VGGRRDESWASERSSKSEGLKSSMGDCNAFIYSILMGWRRTDKCYGLEIIVIADTFVGAAYAHKSSPQLSWQDRLRLMINRKM
jgi:hypothetical protein